SSPLAKSFASLKRSTAADSSCPNAPTPWRPCHHENPTNRLKPCDACCQSCVSSINTSAARLRGEIERFSICRQNRPWHPRTESGATVDRPRHPITSRAPSAVAPNRNRCGIVEHHDALAGIKRRVNHVWLRAGEQDSHA